MPYSIRVRPYNGASTTVRGDIRTVGMAGATMGLGDTFIAATDNPAGLAMTMNTGDFNFTSNWVHDARVQDYNAALNTTNLGVALNTYPWGFSLGYVVPYRESADYEIAGMPGQPVTLTTTVREFRASAGRVLFNNRLSLGVSLILGQSEAEYTPVGSPEQSQAHHSYSVGASVGAMVQLPRRYLLGVSLTPSMHLSGEPSATVGALPGFFQPFEVPGRFGVGLGQIPNRFLRSDFSIFFIGTTPNTALLRDQTIILGQSVTVQPRIGAAYQFAEFKEFNGTLFGGLYYETVRISTGADRIHLTGGIETKPWIFTIGWGFDTSAGYRNNLVTFGIDIFKVMAKLDLIPQPWHPPRAGWFPGMSESSDEGLARPLVKDWKPRGPQIDPIQVGLDLPMKIQEKIRKAGEGLSEIAEEILPKKGRYEREQEAKKKAEREAKKKKLKRKQKKMPQKKSRATQLEQ